MLAVYDMPLVVVLTISKANLIIMKSFHEVL